MLLTRTLAMATLEERMQALEVAMAQTVLQSHLDRRLQEHGQQVTRLVQGLNGVINNIWNKMGRQENIESQDKLMHKQAQPFIPKIFQNKDDENFIEYAHSLKNWALAFYDSGPDILEIVEAAEGEINMEEISLQFGKAVEFNKMLYSILLQSTSGEPRIYVQNAGQGKGLKAWRELNIWYDPRRGIDKTAELTSIISPVARAKDDEQAIKMIKEWEAQVIRYETRFGAIEDGAKIVGLKAVIPAQLLEGKIRGERYSRFVELKKVIDDYLRDRNNTINKAGQDISACARESRGESTNIRHDKQMNDVLAALDYYSKQHNKGSTYKGGWYQHKGEHRAGGKGERGKGWRREEDKGKGKGRKGDKGKGKGGKGVCFNCGGTGHFARDCNAGKGIHSCEEPWADGEENYAYYEQDAEEDVAEMACIMAEEEANLWRRGIAKLTKPSEPMKIVLKNRFTPLKETVDAIDEEEGRGEEIMTVMEKKGEWVRLSATVDSGASNSVAPPALFPHVKLEESDGSKRGQHYVAANGSHIQNEGKKCVVFRTNENVSRRITFQCAKVTKPLISVDKMTEAGYDVILSKSDPRIVHSRTGEVTRLRREKGVFILDMWMPASVFSRQG